MLSTCVDRNSFQPWPCVASEATIWFMFEAFEHKLEQEYAQCVSALKAVAH